MPLEELVEFHGGQMLKSFAQGKFMKAKEYSQHLDRGVCSALSTTWIARRAQGKDFFKFIDTADGRNEVAMLQGREEGLSESLRALGSEAQKISKEAEAVGNSPLNSLLGFLPDAVQEIPFVSERVRAQGKKVNELKVRGDNLKQTAQFLKTLSADQHQFRVDYIQEKTGLQGEIAKTTSGGAPGTVSGKEGFVIFGMNGHGNRGHAVALFHGRDGVRFFDPNLGEAFFESQQNFRAFLGEFVRYYSEQNRLGQLKNVEITDFAYPIMPRSPEDAELTDHGYLPLNLSFQDWMDKGTAEETQPLLSDTDLE